MARFDGAVALVSGGSRGIGEAIVRGLHAEGAWVCIGDVLDAEGGALADELGERVVFQHLDVTDPASWQEAVARCEDEAGPVSVLINNAGVLGVTPIGEGATDEWKRVMAVNADGVFMGMDAVAPSMRRGGGGAIVNASSTAGLQGYASMAAYVASKWAVRGMTKTAALELGPHGIRVNSVHPGPITSNMTQQVDPSIADSQAIARFGRPEEVARLYLFLASDDSSYSTGAEFLVDGGQTLGSTGSVLED